MPCGLAKSSVFWDVTCSLARCVPEEYHLLALDTKHSGTADKYYFSEESPHISEESTFNLFSDVIFLLLKY